MDDQRHGPPIRPDRKTVCQFKNADRERGPNGVLEPFESYLNAGFTNGNSSGTSSPRRPATAVTSTASWSSASTSPPQVRYRRTCPRSSIQS